MKINLKVWLQLSRNFSLKNIFKISLKGGKFWDFIQITSPSYNTMKMRPGKLGIVIVIVIVIKKFPKFFPNWPLARLEHVLSHLLAQELYWCTLHGNRANMMGSFESSYLLSPTQQAAWKREGGILKFNTMSNIFL